MKVINTSIEGVLIIEPAVFRDARGQFLETWNKERYASHGINCDFVQDNISVSSKGVLRGLHFQNPNPQAKLVQAIEGEIFDVAVDIRKGSPTYGRWEGVILSSESRRQLLVPRGFAHGFVALSETAIVSYKCDGLYHKESDRGIRWDDPDLGINWPVEAPELSEKDLKAPLLKDLDEEAAPVY